MERMTGFLYAKPQKVLALQTTRSPKFLGLQPHKGLWPRANFGQGIIIGVIDNEIKPDHLSFSDEVMPTPLTKWKGKCRLNGTTCNKKLIGATRIFLGMTGLPVDVGAHGTHTASTAAGAFVSGANVFGQSNGTTTGMAPRAHLAIYQACEDDGCEESTILAAMEAAIADGVNVLSLSIGGQEEPYFADGIAIGVFRAIQNGIIVSCAAGNGGPFHGTLSNTAPWILTVGTSTIDRSFRATAVLGNNAWFDGVSVHQPKVFPRTLLPLVRPTAGKCAPGTLNKTLVVGNVVLCEADGPFETFNLGQAVRDTGGAAMIVVNGETDLCAPSPQVDVIPTTTVSLADGEAIKEYINSTFAPTAMIAFEGTVVGLKEAPAIAFFSSRGPSLTSPGILKPDIVGPGVSILPAWPSSVDNTTNSTASFNLQCGTSMSTPHLSGITALIRSLHPDWSPAAVKSAIMTSADFLNHDGSLILDERKLPTDLFAIGAGHVNPARAADPGLVYDIHPDDYLQYLCGLNYTDDQIVFITQRRITCTNINSIPEAELNYPSFSIQLGSDTQTYRRTVTNVDKTYSVYNSLITSIPGIDIHVYPTVLRFTRMNQKITYQISFKRTDRLKNATYMQGSITWSSKQHSVRSPILIKLI
ncbi:unnamed protein product [Coffea canephora]|uniref:DH200=94 genomic scaffold, scaffold_1166 n=1 Tax=Coffea canephora TaxID=49390 RepID=A0A068VHT7_COFCA|nr:unnamed protein product [Coffea canephora]